MGSSANCTWAVEEPLAVVGPEMSLTTNAAITRTTTPARVSNHRLERMSRSFLVAMQFHGNLAGMADEVLVGTRGPVTIVSIDRRAARNAVDGPTVLSPRVPRGARPPGSRRL